MAVVVDDELIANPFYIEARACRAERTETDGDAEDAVDIGANRNDWGQGIIERQR